MRRYVIRDINTKKIKFLNNRKLDFNYTESAIGFLLWMPFGVGNYYEVYDFEERKIIYSPSLIVTRKVAKR